MVIDVAQGDRASDRVLAALGGSLVRDELRGDFAAASRLAAELLRAARRSTAEDRADALLAAGMAALLAGSPRAASSRLAAARSLSSDPLVRARAATLEHLAAFQQWFFLPGGGGHFLLTECRARMDLQQTVQAAEQRRAEERATLAGPNWQAEDVLVHDVLCLRPAVLGSEFATGELVRPDMARNLVVGLLQRIQRLRSVTESGGLGSLAAFAQRTLAEVAFRIRDPEAGSLLAAAHAAYEQASDAVGAASCLLTEAGWIVAPLAGAAVLDLAVQEAAGSGSDLAPVHEALELTVATREATGAGALLAEAARRFQAAGSRRGVAMVELHLSHLAFAGDQFDEQFGRASAAGRGFAATGDRLSENLAVVHQIAARIGQGRLRDGHDSAVAIGRWGRGTGSFSHALGLGLLLCRLARHWLIRRADRERALAGYRIARTLFQELGAATNAHQTIVDEGLVHGRMGLASLERAAYRHAIGRYLDDMRERAVIAADAARRARELAGSLLQNAMRGRQPTELEDAVALVEEVLERTGGGRRGADLIASLCRGEYQTFEHDLTAVQLGSSLLQAQITLPLLAARQARREGASERSEELFDLAVQQAAGLPAPQDAFWRAVVLAVARRFDQAIDAYNQYQLGGGHRASVIGDLAAPLARFGQAGQQAVASYAHTDDRDAATFYARARSFQRAHTHLDHAEQVAGPHWWRLEQPPWSARALYAEIAEGTGDLRQALALYEEAIGLLEAERVDLITDDHRAAQADDRNARALYVGAARAALSAAARASGARRDALAKFAFHQIHRAWARALLDLAGGVRQLSGLPSDRAAALHRWKHLSSKAAALRSQLALLAGPATTGPAPLVAALQEAETALARVEEALQATWPEFAQVANPHERVLSADEVGQRLPAGSGLLTWAQVDDDLLVFLLTAGPAGRLRRRRARIEPDRLEYLLSSFAHACREGWPVAAAASPVAQLLLAPFSTQLQELDKLIVVPFGPGHQVPLHAVEFEGGPLAARFPVSYLPTASLIGTLDSQAVDRLPAGPALVVGNPTGMAWIPPGGGTREPFAPLTFAADEARAVAAQFERPTVLIGDDATKDRVAAAMPAQRIVHLAAHGRLSTEAPQLSAVLLANGEHLSTYDILGIGLDADLVVLSACDTGGGTATDGEEVVGLARALLGAGARSTVVSLWAANDLSTCLLMTRWYKAMRAGQPAGQALASTQLELSVLTLDQQIDELIALQALLEQTSAPATSLTTIRAEVHRRRSAATPPPPNSDFRHPRYWAPFIHIGA